VSLRFTWSSEFAQTVRRDLGKRKLRQGSHRMIVVVEAAIVVLSGTLIALVLA